VRLEKNDQQNDMVFDDIAKHTLKYIPKKWALHEKDR
jgi:hypothetical protein